MQKIIDFIENVMGPFSEKMSKMQFLQALSETMQALMSVTIVGAFACLFAFVDIPPWQAFLDSAPWVRVTFMTVQSLTLSIIALYVVMILPFRYATRLKVKNPIVLIGINVAAFLLITPTNLYTNIPSEWLGHKGMIAAMIVTYVVVRVYKLFLDKNISIKMPESVPEFVSASFTALLPGVCILFPLAFLGQILGLTEIGSLHNLIYTVIQAPIQNIAGNYFGFLVYTLVGGLGFFCGIHGSAITAWMDPVLKANSLANTEAWSAGLPLPHILDAGVVATAFAGGQALTLGACLAVVIFGKSQRLKNLGRVCIVPQLFNISEPILFGLPIMLNPMFFVPYVVTLVFNCTASYVTRALGLVLYTGLDPSWTIPMVLKAFFISQTPIRAAIIQFLIIVVDILIYMPFIKIFDKQCLEAEKAE
jgi:PTS system cellobiose-specific IIC component